MGLQFDSYEETKLLGVVADHCPNCRRTEAFTVYRRRRVDHLLNFSIREKVIGYQRFCSTCRREYACDRKAYDRFIPVRSANLLSVDELLEQTNTKLRDELRHPWDRPRSDFTPEDSDGAGPPLLSQLIPDEHGELLLRQTREKLAPFAERPDAGPLNSQLEEWAWLTPDSRRKLVRRIEDYVARRNSDAEMLATLGKLGSGSPKTSWQTWVLWAVLTVAAIMAIKLYPRRIDPRFPVFHSLGVFIASPVSLVLLKKRRDKRWLRQTVIPRLELDGLDPTRTQQFMGQLRFSDPRATREVCRMLAHAAGLRAILVADGKWDSSAERFEA